MLAAYGFADGWEGCAVRSSMDVVPVAGDHDLPVPIVTDAHAAAAAATIVVNRVKQHTDFHGPYESGLMKMTAIGLGKRVQAEALHAHGTRGLRELMPRVAEHVLANANIVLGVAHRGERARPDDGGAGRAGGRHRRPPSRRCSTLAAAHAARLPVDDLDVLLIDRMGKDISGVGIDTNVIGRTMIAGEPDPPAPRIAMIAVPRADAGVARQRHRHGPRRRRHPPARRRHRPRGHPHQRRHVRVPAARQAAGRRRRRPPRRGSCACAAPAWSTGRRCGRRASSTRCTARELWVTDAVLADLAGRADVEVVERGVARCTTPAGGAGRRSRR